MSTIAQRLCDDLVEPPLKQSSNDNEEGCSRQSINKASSKYHGRPTKTVFVEKKKILNKLASVDSNASKCIINQYKSKEVLMRRRLRDIAINTNVTGPLRCDNDCITMIRRKDNRKSCKCGQKNNNSKTNIKETQTYSTKDFQHTDKACAQCIETSSRSTQYLESIVSGVVHNTGFGTNTAKPVVNQMQSEHSHHHKDSSCTNKFIALKKNSNKNILKCSSNSTKTPSYNYMGARRWALSKYPTRGPDF